MPDAFRVRLLPRAAQASVIFGSKAVGEPPLMLAISVREAILLAIQTVTRRLPAPAFLSAPR